MRQVAAIVFVCLMIGVPAAADELNQSGPGESVSASSSDTRIQAMVDEVGWDQVLGDLQWLVAMGNRWTLYSGIHTVADSLEARLAAYGLVVEQQDYILSGWPVPVPNVIATQVGTEFPDSTYVICAHFDSCDGRPRADYVGADDDGSGVVAVLTAARLLSQREFRCTIKYVLFSGEEQGIRGSVAWVASQAAAGANIAGALNLDMIGWWVEGVPYDLDLATDEKSLWLATVEADCAAAYVGMPIVVHPGGTGGADASAFWQAGYAAVSSVEAWEHASDFNPYWHSANDRVENIAPTFMTKNVQVVLASLATLAGLPGSATPVDPVLAISSGPSLGAFPNPFAGRISLELAAPGVEGPVDVEMYDLRGRRVRTVTMTLEGGRAESFLDAVDPNGAPLPTGVYLLRASTSAGPVVRRVTYVR